MEVNQTLGQKLGLYYKSMFETNWELGQEVYYIEPNYGTYGKDKIQMIGFTKRGVRIKLSNHHPHNKDFSEKYIFKSEEEMKNNLMWKNFK